MEGEIMNKEMVHVHEENSTLLAIPSLDAIVATTLNDYEDLDKSLDLKKTRAELNKIIESVHSKRVELKNSYMQPYEAFVKELESKIEPLVKLLEKYDERIQFSETLRKSEIQTACLNIYQAYMVTQELPPFERFMDNAIYLRTNEKKFEKMFTERIEKFIADVKYIQENEKYPEMIPIVIEEYTKVLDIVKASANSKAKYSIMFERKFIVKKEDAKFVRELLTKEGIQFDEEN